MVKIGFAPGIHGNIRVAKRIARKFEKERVDFVVLNGDTPTLENQSANLEKVLKVFSKFKTYVMPGSHESYYEYYAAVKKSKVKSITTIKKIGVKGLDLVFLPGSTASEKGHGFRIARDKKQKKKVERFMK